MLRRLEDFVGFVLRSSSTINPKPLNLGPSTQSMASVALLLMASLGRHAAKARPESPFGYWFGRLGLWTWDIVLNLVMYPSRIYLGLKVPVQECL